MIEIEKVEKDLRTELRSGERTIMQNLNKSAEQKMKQEIQNSIFHIEASLEKFLKDGKESDLKNVYWHIGAIQGAIR